MYPLCSNHFINGCNNGSDGGKCPSCVAIESGSIIRLLNYPKSSARNETNITEKKTKNDKMKMHKSGRFSGFSVKELSVLCKVLNCPECRDPLEGKTLSVAQKKIKNRLRDEVMKSYLEEH